MFKLYSGMALVVGGAIALSSLIAPTPAPSQEICQGTENLSASESTRMLTLKQFGLRVQIPANFRAMLRNDESVAIYPPGDFKLVQCLAQGIPVPGTDAVSSETFSLLSNTQGLTPQAYGTQTAPKNSAVTRQTINGIDVAIREDPGMLLDIAYGWYQLPQSNKLVQVKAHGKAQLLDLLNRSQLITAQSKPETTTASTREVFGNEKAKIFNAIVQEQQALGLCEYQTDLANNLDRAKIYTQGEGTYLVNVFCRNAAYQSVHEFIQVETVNEQFKITHSGLHLAGFPTFDPQNNILTNEYKFNGLAACMQLSQHYWSGYDLKLVSSTFEDGIKNGCQEWGVRSPSPERLITSTSVGVAKLGMTLSELKQALPKEATFEPIQLGVDIPDGLRMKSYGDGYDLIFDNSPAGDRQARPITDQSKITSIIVRSPWYLTAEGVGPGTRVKDAIAHYGRATLGYNTESESRESIKFANGLFGKNSDSRVWLRSNQWTITGFAGQYPKTQSSFHQTQNYHDHAAIGSIWIMQNP